MLTVGMLMRLLEKPFGAEDLLHVYTIVQSKSELGNLLSLGNHYLHLRHPDQPQIRLVTSNPDKDLFLDEFIWVWGNWEFRAGDDVLWSFPRFNGCLPDSTYLSHRIYTIHALWVPYIDIDILFMVSVQISMISLNSALTNARRPSELPTIGKSLGK